MRQAISRKDFLSLSGDLAYEIWMLDCLRDALATQRRIPAWLNNSIVESFAIHARVLLEFFYGHGKKPTDARATDFIDPLVLRANPRPKESPRLLRVRSRAGFQVSHLSYLRTNVKSEEKNWDYSDIWADINDLVNWFTLTATPDLFGEDFKRVISRR